MVEGGVALGERESRNFFIYLFGVEGFYVEAYFFKESGEYSTLKSFDDVGKLEPYLGEIEVGELLAQ